MTDENLLNGGQGSTNTDGGQQGAGNGANGAQGAQGQQGAGDGAAAGQATGAAGEGQGNKAGAEGEKGAPVVPEKYEIQLPEGVALDDEIFGEFSEFAKGKKLTQEDVQEHVNFAVKLQQKWASSQMEAWKKVNTEWVTAAKNDKDFGGAKFTESLAAANNLLASLNEPELVAALQQTGMANHPAMFRALVKLSKHVTPDKFVGGGSPAPAERSIADRLFGS